MGRGDAVLFKALKAHLVTKVLSPTRGLTVRMRRLGIWYIVRMDERRVGLAHTGNPALLF